MSPSGGHVSYFTITVAKHLVQTASKEDLALLCFKVEAVVNPCALMDLCGQADTREAEA